MSTRSADSGFPLSDIVPSSYSDTELRCVKKMSVLLERLKMFWLIITLQGKCVNKNCIKFYKFHNGVKMYEPITCLNSYLKNLTFDNTFLMLYFFLSDPI